MTPEKEKTRTAELRMSEDGIIHIDMLPNTEVSLKDAQVNYDTVLKISKGKPHSLLIDSNPLST
ncbi:hypothetical protein ACFL7M_12200 [Thermodesulfobacteriota bacterium]